MNHAYCRFAWDEAAGLSPSRRPFALPGAKPRYAPDRPARVDHIALTVSFDFDAKTLFGKCATTFTAVGKTIDAVELDAAQLTIKRVLGAKGAPLSYSLQGPKLRIEIPRLAPGRSTTVAVEYEAHRP